MVRAPIAGASTRSTSCSSTIGPAAARCSTSVIPCGVSQSPGLDTAVAELGSVLAALSAEIAKCDRICANCHAERTFRRRADLRAAVQPSWCRRYPAERPAT